MRKIMKKLCIVLVISVLASGYILNLQAKENLLEVSGLSNEKTLEEPEEIDTKQEDDQTSGEAEQKSENMEVVSPMEEATETMEDEEEFFDETKESGISEILKSNGKEASITIWAKTEYGKGVSGKTYELYGVNGKESEREEIPEMEGVKLYKKGAGRTDENGILQFCHLSTDAKEWYIIKDMETKELLHVQSLPYYLDYEPSESYRGYYKKEDGNYGYYDVIFESIQGEFSLAISPKEESIAAQSRVLLQTSIEDGAWLKLYSTVKPRSSGRVLARICKIKKNSSGKSEGHSIFRTSGDLYMACCEHEHRYPTYGSNGESFSEKYYTGKNAAKIRKTLYYGYGGYDQGKTYYKTHSASRENYFIATVLLCSHYHGHSNPFSEWVVYKNLKKFVEAQPDPNKIDLSASKISFSKEKNKMHRGIVDGLEAISEGAYKDLYWSDEIIAKSNGTKTMKLSVPAGVIVYRVNTEEFIPEKSSDHIVAVNPGENLKFGSEKRTEELAINLKLVSEGGIREYKAVYADTEVSSHQDMLRAYYETETKKEANLVLFMEITQPEYDIHVLSDTMTQYAKIRKVNEEGETLEGAEIQIICENGESKTCRTDENGESKVPFEIIVETPEYRYLTNKAELTTSQIEEFLQKRPYNFETKEKAVEAAQRKLDEIKAESINHYKIKEIVPPEGYLASILEYETEITGDEGESEWVTIVDEAFPEVAFLKEKQYFYQEVKAIKENAFFETENNAADDPKYLEGATFQVRNIKMEGNVQLVKIIYNNQETIKVIEETDGQALSNPHQTVAMVTRARGGAAQAGFLYSVTSTGVYGYPEKNWDSYTKQQQDKMDEKGIYHSYEAAKEEAQKEINSLLKSVSCTYGLQEVKAPISLSGKPFIITFPEELTKRIADAEGSVIDPEEAYVFYEKRFLRG